MIPCGIWSRYCHWCVLEHPWESVFGLHLGCVLCWGFSEKEWRDCLLREVTLEIIVSGKKEHIWQSNLKENSKTFWMYNMITCSVQTWMTWTNSNRARQWLMWTGRVWLWLMLMVASGCNNWLWVLWRKAYGIKDIVKWEWLVWRGEELMMDLRGRGVTVN